MDLIVGGFAMCLAYRLTPASVAIATATQRHLGLLEAALLYSVLLTLTAHAIGAHNNRNLQSRAKIVILNVVSVILAMTMFTLVLSLVLYSQVGRIILMLCAGLTVIIGGALRLAVHRNLSVSPLRVRVAGDEKLRGFLAELSVESPTRMIICDESDTGAPSDVVVVSEAWLSSPGETESCLQWADQGLPIYTAVAFVESNFYRVPVQYVSASWLFSIDLRRLHPFYHQLKRSLDLALASVGLLLSVPIILLAAILILLENRGPIFYSQIRVGLFQRPFRIWKLRTMRTDAEKSGPQWASVVDPRVTWIGRILRKTRIDELPQFWNILLGDMAFVGPRPERPEFVAQLATEIPYYRQRHLVKPGLTGWAQICYPYGASTKDASNKLSYDFYYMKNFSLILDLQIMLQTVGAAFRGAR